VVAWQCSWPRSEPEPKKRARPALDHKSSARKEFHRRLGDAQNKGTKPYCATRQNKSRCLTHEDRPDLEQYGVTRPKRPKPTETGKTETPPKDLAGEACERSRKQGRCLLCVNLGPGRGRDALAPGRCDLELTSGPRALNSGRAQENPLGKTFGAGSKIARRKQGVQAKPSGNTIPGRRTTAEHLAPKTETLKKTSSSDRI
jgi:hypothetical protein